MHFHALRSLVTSNLCGDTSNIAQTAHSLAFTHLHPAPRATKHQQTPPQHPLPQLVLLHFPNISQLNLQYPIKTPPCWNTRRSVFHYDQPIRREGFEFESVIKLFLKWFSAAGITSTVLNPLVRDSAQDRTGCSFCSFNAFDYVIRSASWEVAEE